MARLYANGTELFRVHITDDADPELTRERFYSFRSNGHVLLRAVTVRPQIKGYGRRLDHGWKRWRRFGAATRNDANLLLCAAKRTADELATAARAKGFAATVERSYQPSPDSQPHSILRVPA